MQEFIAFFVDSEGQKPGIKWAMLDGTLQHLPRRSDGEAEISCLVSFAEPSNSC